MTKKNKPKPSRTEPVADAANGLEGTAASHENMARIIDGVASEFFAFVGHDSGIEIETEVTSAGADPGTIGWLSFSIGGSKERESADPETRP